MSNTIRLQPQDIKQIFCKWSHLKKRIFQNKFLQKKKFPEISTLFYV